jgi:5-carboxymethyl-2-hydroxymuconate isomerase
MPHIHLETTCDLAENANIPDILQALADRLGVFETIDPVTVKADHILRSVWATGEGARPGFAHCTVCILSGTPPELRQRIADALYAVMEEWFVDSGEADEASLTLEVRDIAAETYRASPL